MNDGGCGMWCLEGDLDSVALPLLRSLYKKNPAETNSAFPRLESRSRDNQATLRAPFP